MRTVPVHTELLRVNSWYTGVLCLYKCASPRAIPWYIFCTTPAHTKFLLVIPKYNFVPCRYRPRLCLQFRGTIFTVPAQALFPADESEVQNLQRACKTLHIWP